VNLCLHISGTLKPKLSRRHYASVSYTLYNDHENAACTTSVDVEGICYASTLQLLVTPVCC